MSIFAYYPKIAYKIDDYNYLKAIDINVVSKLKDYITQYRSIGYTPYVVQDGDIMHFRFNV